MYHWVNAQGVIEASWHTLPTNYRADGVIYSRLPATHPNVKVGIPYPDQPTPVEPFESGAMAYEYDEANNCVWEGIVLTQVPLDEAKRLAHELINAERERREGPAQDVDLGGEDGVISVDTRNERDFRNLLGLAMSATLAIQQGDDSPFPFKDADNVIHELTPQQVLVMAQGVSSAIHEVIAWSWALKEAVSGAQSTDEVITLLQAEGVI